MLVKRSSWHFQLINFWHNEKYNPEHAVLCKYFWTVVLFSLISLILSPVLLAVLLAYFTVEGWKKAFPVDQEKKMEKKAEKMRKRIMKADERRAKQLERDLNKGEPGLVRSFVRAKKDKVCPLIEFVD